MQQCVTFYCWNWYMPHRNSAALCIFNSCFQNLSHRSYQKIVKEYTVKLTIWLSIWTILLISSSSIYLVNNDLDKQGLVLLMADMFIWDMNEAFWQASYRLLQVILCCWCGPLCGAVCTNGFEKCTYCFENVMDDLRISVPKRLKTTVVKEMRGTLPGLHWKTVTSCL